MNLPNASEAIVDIEKLRDYCLSSDYPVGKHKARVFLASLGLTKEDAEKMRSRLLDAARQYECIATKQTTHGQHFEMDFMLSHEGRVALVRAIWIIRHDEEFPRLVTFHVL